MYTLYIQLPYQANTEKVIIIITKTLRKLNQFLRNIKTIQTYAVWLELQLLISSTKLTHQKSFLFLSYNQSKTREYNLVFYLVNHFMKTRKSLADLLAAVTGVNDNNNVLIDF